MRQSSNGDQGMNGQKCDVCGAPATIHETAVENSQIVVRHLCQNHGKDLIPAIDFANHEAARQTVMEMYNRLSDTEKNELALLHRWSKRVG
jgi:hypothetical protein